jgi:uncharacterized protein YndB with AHSA1/START domain
VLAAQVTDQRYIDAPVLDVWELVGDPNRHSEWWPEVRASDCEEITEGCSYRGVVKGFFGTKEHELLIERLERCHEVAIHCAGTGVTTRFLLIDAQGGTFVEAQFSIEPNSIGTKLISAVAGRRLMRRWLQSSLESLKHVAERAPAARA